MGEPSQEAWEEVKRLYNNASGISDVAAAIQKHMDATERWRQEAASRERFSQRMAHAKADCESQAAIATKRAEKAEAKLIAASARAGVSETALRFALEFWQKRYHASQTRVRQLEARLAK